MPRDPIQTCTKPSASLKPAPYRGRPLADPELSARLDEALSAARSELRSEGRLHRWSTGLAAGGYIAAAILSIPLGGSDAGYPRSVVWAPVAAGATCALVRGSRAGARTEDLEAEIADLERLSATLTRAPG